MLQSSTISKAAVEYVNTRERYGTLGIANGEAEYVLVQDGYYAMSIADLFDFSAMGPKIRSFPERLIGAQATDKVRVSLHFFPRSVLMTHICLIWMSHINIKVSEVDDGNPNALSCK
jgi:hypothetical protein